MKQSSVTPNKYEICLYADSFPSQYTVIATILSGDVCTTTFVSPQWWFEPSNKCLEAFNSHSEKSSEHSVTHSWS